MSFLENRGDFSSVHEKQKVAGMALRFVYPGIIVADQRISPRTAVIALYLARALDGTSRATYGAFKFYEGVTTGILKGQLSWQDVPKAAIDAARDALKDDIPKRNAIASAFIHRACPQRLMQQHLNNPETFPPPELKIHPGTPLHNIMFERKGLFESLL